MAVSTGYDTGIRNSLTQKGISNDRISYDQNKGVMVDGQSFMKPDKVYNGTSFTNQGNFNSAWDAYSKAQQHPAQTTTAQTGGQQYNPYSQVGQQNPYTSQADDIIKQLLNYNQNQPAFDPYSSAGYAAAQAQAGRAAQASTRSAQEAYGSAGFGRSTGLGERVAGINNDSTEYLMTQVVPQLQAQEQARRQQEYNNQVTSLQQLMSQQGRADNLVQQDFNNGITKAGLTGNYLPQGADQIISQILALKGQAETKGLASDARKGLSSQADTLRSQLAAMGVDPTAFGANVNRANAASASNIGTRTLAGQQMDENIRQYDQNFERDVLVDDRNFDRGVFTEDRGFNEGVRQYNKNFEYTAGRDKVADAQWMKQFDEQVKQNGIGNALNWAQNAISQQNANTSAYSASTSRMNANDSRSGQDFNQKMDIWKATGVAPSGIPGVSQGTPYSSGAANKAADAAPTKNEIEADLYSNIDRMVSQGQDLTSFFKNEKSNIIADIGKSGFDALKKSYGIYE